MSLQAVVSSRDGILICWYSHNSYMGNGQIFQKIHTHQMYIDGHFKTIFSAILIKHLIW